MACAVSGCKADISPDRRVQRLQENPTASLPPVAQFYMYLFAWTLSISISNKLKK
ncbi:MAG: hypothetical protein HLUCCA04_01200 [Oceanicaulis sp. HLUCCA04]|nr:MAG: hypothetical protein HLUCCA04_01200 [Oceanicaulis sp. HLUCCA04]